MSSISSLIDFTKLNASEFEEICFELLLKIGFSKISWRKGGADSGRDIEASMIVNNNLVEWYPNRYFIECKHYSSGVSPEKLNSKIAWADAERPDHLVFIVSSYITNGAREWVEKLSHGKAYRIHIIEGDKLKHLLAQHDEIVKKYFLKDEINSLLNETRNNWLLHGLIPSFSTFVYLFNKINIDTLPLSDVVFLYLLYYTNYHKLEEVENKLYNGELVDDHISLLERVLCQQANFNGSVLVGLADIETLSDEGCLAERYDEEDVDYKFMASEVLVNSKDRNKYSLVLYLFKRLDEGTAIELLMHRNSSFENRIRLITDYSFTHFKDAVRRLNFYNKEYENHIIKSSHGMS